MKNLLGFLLVALFLVCLLPSQSAVGQDPPDVVYSAFELTDWNADSTVTDPTNGNVLEYLSHRDFPEYRVQRIVPSQGDTVITGAAFIGDTLVVYDESFFPDPTVIQTGAEAFFDFVTADPGTQTLDVWWIGEQFRILRNNAEGN